MMQLQFNGDNDMIRLKAYFKRGDNVIEVLLPDNKVFESKDISKGFKIYIFGKEIDCSDYTTRYDIISDTKKQAFFSNDGSVETEDNTVSVIWERTGPIIISKEEIEETKESMIMRSKSALEIFLKRPLISYAYNNTKGYYTVTMEKQNLMMARLMTYNLEKLVNPNAAIKWNEKDKGCEVWSEEDFMKLIADVKNYVDAVVSYQQALEVQIRNCSTMEELESIEINYEQFAINDKGE